MSACTIFRSTVTDPAGFTVYVGAVAPTLEPYDEAVIEKGTNHLYRIRVLSWNKQQRLRTVYHTRRCHHGHDTG
jgi:hypothetical protein